MCSFGLGVIGITLRSTEIEAGQLALLPWVESGPAHVFGLSFIGLCSVVCVLPGPFETRIKAWVVIAAKAFPCCSSCVAYFRTSSTATATMRAVCGVQNAQSTVDLAYLAWAVLSLCIQVW